MCADVAIHRLRARLLPELPEATYEDVAAVVDCAAGTVGDDRRNTE